MKTIFNITAAIILAVTLSACKDDVKDISSDSDIASAVQGEVVHTAVIASGIKGEVSKLGDGIYAFSLAIKGERKIPTGITFACDPTYNEMAVNANMYGEDNRTVIAPAGLSVINLKAGTTEVTERDEETGVVFSTANGDTDIIKFLTSKLGKLKGDSYVTFTFDIIDDQDNTVAGGWSPIVKVKDLVKVVDKLNLGVFGKSTLAVDSGEWISTFTDEDVIRSAR